MIEYYWQNNWNFCVRAPSENRMAQQWHSDILLWWRRRRRMQMALVSVIERGAEGPARRSSTSRRTPAWRSWRSILGEGSEEGEKESGRRGRGGGAGRKRQGGGKMEEETRPEETICAAFKTKVGCAADRVKWNISSSVSFPRRKWRKWQHGCEFVP